MNRTAFVILKPDCIARGLVGEVIKRFEAKGFDIIQMRMARKNEEWARRHYGHLSPTALEENVQFMAKSRLIGIILQGHNDIVMEIKKMVGNTNSSIAIPGSIRGDFGGQPIRFNVIHCSDADKVDSEVEAFQNMGTDYVYRY
jgi:nucleoside-diphosphate kinase